MNFTCALSDEANSDKQASTTNDEGNIQTISPDDANLQDGNVSECKPHNGIGAIEGCKLSEDTNSNQLTDSDYKTLKQDTFDIMYPVPQVNRENQTNVKTQIRNSKRKLCSMIFSSSDSSESDQFSLKSSCGKRPNLSNKCNNDSEPFTLQWQEPRQPSVSGSEMEQFTLQLQEHLEDECPDSFLESTEADVVFKKYVLPSQLDSFDHIFASTQHAEREIMHDKTRHTGALPRHNDSGELAFLLSVKNSLQYGAKNILVDSNDLCLDEEDTEEIEDSQFILD